MRSSPSCMQHVFIKIAHHADKILLVARMKAVGTAGRHAFHAHTLLADGKAARPLVLGQVQDMALQHETEAVARVDHLNDGAVVAQRKHDAGFDFIIMENFFHEGLGALPALEHNKILVCNAGKIDPRIFLLPSMRRLNERMAGRQKSEKTRNVPP